MYDDATVARRVAVSGLLLGALTAALIAAGLSGGSGVPLCVAVVTGLTALRDFATWVHAARRTSRVAAAMEPLRRALAYEPDDRPR